MSLESAVIAQFRRPSGLLGRAAGFVMAHRPSNRERNRWAVSLLDLEPDDRVLEIGFGPGLALALVAREVTRGMVVGLDHSLLMVTRASARNAQVIEAKRLEILCGGLERLGAFRERFTKVFSVNVAQFFADPVADLCAIRRAMAPGGLLVNVHQPRHRGATAGDAVAFGDRLAGAMREAGFLAIDIKRLPLDPVPAMAVRGRAPQPADPTSSDPRGESHGHARS
jgi:SAM-dependent methyltransferase